MTASRPDQVLTELLAAMAEAGVRTALFGGYAVVTWGIPRATFDVDLLIDADDAAVAESLAALERHGFLVDAIYKSGWRDRVRDMPVVKVQMFRGAHAVTGDLFLVATPLQRSAFDRCLAVHVPGIAEELRVISAADLILFKLLADRPKDRLDIQNVLTVQGIPDPEYLTTWAKRVAVDERLRRAITEAGLGS